jgi:hypothetical protein
MASEPRALGSRLYGLYVIALASALLGNLLLRMSREGDWLPRWLDVVVALATVAPLAAAAVWFRRALTQDLDEMLQKIVLEGFSFALVVWLPLSALYLNLRSAGVYMPRLDPPDILMGPAVLVAVGIALAARRYR